MVCACVYENCPICVPLLNSVRWGIKPCGQNYNNYGRVLKTFLWVKKFASWPFFSKCMQNWHMNVQETNIPSWEWCYLQYMLQLSLVIAHFKVHTLHSTMVGVSLSDRHKHKWPFYMYDNEYPCILASIYPWHYVCISTSFPSLCMMQAKSSLPSQALPAFPCFSVLQVTESWVGLGMRL